MYGLNKSPKRDDLKMACVKHWVDDIDLIPNKSTLCIYDISELSENSGKLSLVLKSLLKKSIQIWIMNCHKPIKINSIEAYNLIFKMTEFSRLEKSMTQKKAMRRAKVNGSRLGRKSKFSEEEKEAIIRDKIISDKSAHEIANEYNISVTTIYRWWQDFINKENTPSKNVQ